MQLIGQAIRHKTFGAGIITNLSEDTITICFQNREKRFVYPDAFQTFLVSNDPNTQQHIEKQIEERDMQAQKIREARQAETDRAHKLLEFKITASSHTVFDIPLEQIGQVIRRGQVSTGTYLSGRSKGRPRIAERIRPNSACLLTALPNGQTERERCVVGAFMVADDFFGEEAHDGVIKGHTHHRLLLPKEHRVPFWAYFGQGAPSRWGNTAFKYCSGDMINRILSDLTAHLTDEEQTEEAVAFYEYFCRINRLHSLIRRPEA